ncbi:6,7-dimethyl-8-ribityllumazine synthase, partial [Bradyrhizobium sp.]|uniref:6,7-dimethyl-8-ribityllumazine synthase n=1 Tax=Bradyrhizobium sp. TaxID=376 RepID=UPI00391CD639
MNQILQDAPTDTPHADTSPTATISADSAPAEPSPPDDAPPAPSHPRFTKPQRVAFVQSAWHRDVVAECRHAFLDVIAARHIARDRVDIFEVPGSFEIPLHAQLLAKTRRYTAIVAAGL